MISNLQKEGLTGGRVKLKGPFRNLSVLMQRHTPAACRQDYCPGQIDEFFNAASRAFDKGYREKDMSPEEAGTRVTARFEGLPISGQIDQIRSALRIARIVLQRPDENGDPTKKIDPDTLSAYASYHLARTYHNRT